MGKGPASPLRWAGTNWDLVFTLALIVGTIGFLQFKSSMVVHGLPKGSAAPMLAAASAELPLSSSGLDKYRGEVVLLDFWATYCGTCASTVPSLERLQAEYGPQGLHVVAISIDDPADTARARQLLADWGGTYELLFDRERALRDAYQVNLLPLTFLIARDGSVAWQQAGTIGGAKYALGLESPKGRKTLEMVLSDR